MAAKPLFARLQEPTRLATWVFSAVQGLDRFGPKARHLLSTTRSAAKTHEPTTRRSLNTTDQAERRRLCLFRAVPLHPSDPSGPAHAKTHPASKRPVSVGLCLPAPKFSETPRSSALRRSTNAVTIRLWAPVIRLVSSSLPHTKPLSLSANLPSQSRRSHAPSSRTGCTPFHTFPSRNSVHLFRMSRSFKGKNLSGCFPLDPFSLFLTIPPGPPFQGGNPFPGPSPQWGRGPDKRSSWNDFGGVDSKAVSAHFPPDLKSIKTPPFPQNERALQSSRPSPNVFQKDRFKGPLPHCEEGPGMEFPPWKGGPGGIAQKKRKGGPRGNPRLSARASNPIGVFHLERSHRCAPHPSDEGPGQNRQQNKKGQQPTHGRRHIQKPHDFPQTFSCVELLEIHRRKTAAQRRRWAR